MVSYCPVVGAGKTKVINNVHRVVRRWPQTPLSFLGRRCRGAGTSHVRRLADTASDEEGAQAEIAQLSERIKTLSEELNKERTSFRTFVMLWGSLQGYKADASRKRLKNPPHDDILVAHYARAAASKLTQANLWAGCLERLADKIADLQSDLDRRTSGRGAAHRKRYRRSFKAKTHAGSSGDERRPSRGDTDAGPSTPSTSSAAGTGMLSPTPLDVVKEQLVTAARESRMCTSLLYYARRRLARLRQGTGTEAKITRATEAYNRTLARCHHQQELVKRLRKKLRALRKEAKRNLTSTEPSTCASQRGWSAALMRLQRYDITPRPEDENIPWHKRPSFRQLSQYYSPLAPVLLKDIADPPASRGGVAVMEALIPEPFPRSTQEHGSPDWEAATEPSLDHASSPSEQDPLEGTSGSGKLLSKAQRPRLQLEQPQSASSSTSSVAQHPSLPSPGSAVGNSPLADNPASGDAPTAFGPPPTPYSSDLPLSSYGAHLAAEGPAGFPDPWAASSASSSPHLPLSVSPLLSPSAEAVLLSELRAEPFLPGDDAWPRAPSPRYSSYATGEDRDTSSDPEGEFAAGAPSLEFVGGLLASASPSPGMPPTRRDQSPSGAGSAGGDRIAKQMTSDSDVARRKSVSSSQSLLPESTASRSLMSSGAHVELRGTAGPDARATPSPSVTLEDPTMKATAQHPLTARQAQAQASAASGCTSVEVVAHKAGKKSAKKKSLEAEVRDRGEVGAIDGSRLLHDAQPLGHLGPGAGASQAPQASLFGQAARSYAGVPHGGGDSPTGHAFQSDLQLWLQGRRIPFKQRESVGSGARADRDESGQAGSSGPSRSPSTRGNMSPHYPEATRKTQR
ncbi:hypothetical protein BESB_030680 [Besnoitia besnoiti]|uniref:Uncharacterized protein n=1 Tax=Besnoitia besnoiti TaxID=94643 RepID=A0A2A9M1S5_BESBE|nr:hypothetical protein BESB_030680 [Besnoitia besnoiti]PFH31194.1 hypothetical protein BESB_030680 [Besnoitia besnoiti]